MCDSHLSADDAHEQASRMSALDLYEDLLIKEDGGDDGDRVLTMQEILSEKHSLEEKNAALLQRLSETENLVKDLESKQLNLQKNFNNLLATAKVELDRKNSLLSHYAGGSAPVARSASNVSHCTKEQDRSSRKKKGLLDMFKGRRLNDDELAAMKSSGPGTLHTPNSLTTLLQHRGEKMVGVATRVIGSSFENMASVTSMNTPFHHQKTIPHVSNNGGQSSNFMDESSEPPTQSSSTIQQDTVDASSSNSRRRRPTSCDSSQRSRSVARVASENIGPRTPSPPSVVRSSKNISRAPPISTHRTSNSSEPQTARVTSENTGPRTPSPPSVVRSSKNISRAPSISTTRTSNSSGPQIVSEPWSRGLATSSNLDTRFDANPTGSQYLSRLGVGQSKKTSMEIPGKNIPKNPDRAKNTISHHSQTSASKTRISNQSQQPSTRKSFVPIAGPVTAAFDSRRPVESREKRSRTTSKEFLERPKSSDDNNIAALKNGISNESRKFSTRRSSQSETQLGSDRNRRPFENPKSRSRSNSEEIASIMKAWDNAVTKVKNPHKAPANAATPAVYDERARTPEAQLPRPTSQNSLSDRNLIADRVESRHSSKSGVARSSSNTKERTGNAQKTSTKISENRKFDNRTCTNRDESSQNRIRSKDRGNDRYYESFQRQRTSSDRRDDDASRSSSRHRERERPRRNSGSRSSKRGSGGRDINEKSNPIEGQERPRDERRDSRQSDLRRSKIVPDSNISQKNESRKSRDLRGKPMRGDKPVKISPKKSKSGVFVSPKKNRKSLPEHHPVETKASLKHTEKSKSGLDSTLNRAMIGVKTNRQFPEIDCAVLKNKPIIPPKSRSRQRPRTPKKLPRTPPQKSTSGDTKKKAEGTTFLEETKTSGGKKLSISGKSHFNVKTKEMGSASSATTSKKSPRRATPKKKKTPKKVLQDDHSKFDTFSNISGDGVSSIAREKTFPCPPSPARSDSREMFGHAQSPAELELDYDEDSLMYREIMQPDAVADKNPVAYKTPAETQLDKTHTNISEEAQAEETLTKTAKSPGATSENLPLLKKTDSTLPEMANSQTPKKGTLDLNVKSNARPSTERDIAGVLLALASSPKYQPRVHLFNISKSPLSKGIKRKPSFETSSASPSIKKTKTTQNDKCDRVSESKSSPKRKPNLPKILPSETTSERAKTNNTNVVPPQASEPEKNPKKDLRISVARVSPPGTPVNMSLIDVAMEVEVETSPKFHTKSKEKSKRKKSKRKRLKVKLKIQKKEKGKKIKDKETTAETKKVSKETCMAPSFSSTLNSSDFFPDLSSSSSSSETAPIRQICEAPAALGEWLDSAKKNKTKKKLKMGETQEEKCTVELLQRKADDAHATAEFERDRIETENAVASICEDLDQCSVDATHLDSQSVVTPQNNVTKNPMRFYCNAALKFLFHLSAEKLKILREPSEKPLDLSLKKRPQPADTVKTATKEQHPAAVVNLFSGAKAPNTTKTSHSQPAKKTPVPKSCQNGTTNPTSGGCSNASEGENFDKLLQKHAEEQKNLKRKDEPDKLQQPPPKKKPRRVALERVEMPEPRRKEIVSPPLSRSLWMTSLVKCQQRRKVRSRWSSEVSESEEQPQCSGETLSTNNNEEKETPSATTNASTPTKLRIKPVLPNSVLGLKRKNPTSKTNKPSVSSCLQDSNETASSSSSRFSVGELLPDMSSSSWQLSEESRCRLQSFAKAVNFLSPIKSSPKTGKTTPQKVNAAKADVKRRVLQSP